MNEDSGNQAITSSPETRIDYLDERELPSVDKMEFDRVNLDPPAVGGVQQYEFDDDSGVQHKGFVEYFNRGFVGRDMVGSVLVEETSPVETTVKIHVKESAASDERKAQLLLGWHILREGLEVDG